MLADQGCSTWLQALGSAWPIDEGVSHSPAVVDGEHADHPTIVMTMASS
jgi:hypothetical protein